MGALTPKLRMLEETGIIRRANFTEEELALLESKLTDAQVQALLSIRDILGPAEQDVLRPNVFI